MALPAAAAAPRNDKLYAAVEASRAGFLDLLSQIVNIDSGTGDVAGGDKVLALLTSRLTALGYGVLFVTHDDDFAARIPHRVLATGDMQVTAE